MNIEALRLVPLIISAASMPNVPGRCLVLLLLGLGITSSQPTRSFLFCGFSRCP